MSTPRTTIILFILFIFSLIAIPFFSNRILNFQSAKLGMGRKFTTIERLAPERLRGVREDRQRRQQSRKRVGLETGFEDYRAILHAHAEDSAHTGGTRLELLGAARQTGVKVIMLTDHVRPPRDFIDDSWRGMHDGVLFIPGAESEGFLAYPQLSIRNKTWKSREEYIGLVAVDGGNLFLSHVEEKDDWATKDLDGLEIYNHHTDFMEETEFIKWLRDSFTLPDRLRQFERILAEYPMEVFGASQDYLPQIIAKWDRELQTRRLTGVAANDCHHNQVFTIKAADPRAIEIAIIGDPPRKVTVEQSPRVAEMLVGRKPGEVIAKLDFDPYDRSLSYLTTHLLLRELKETAVREALKQSRAYVAHDWLCDPTGFAFLAERNGQRIAGMGEEVKLDPGLRLKSAAPIAGHIKLIRNGNLIRETLSDTIEFEVREAGVYRIEIWLEIDRELRPWIYSNPIRVMGR